MSKVEQTATLATGAPFIKKNSIFDQNVSLVIDYWKKETNSEISWIVPAILEEMAVHYVIEKTNEDENSVMGVCIYCNSLVSDIYDVPKVHDDESWERLACEHLDVCEWIWTHAHRKFDNQ